MTTTVVLQITFYETKYLKKEFLKKQKTKTISCIVIKIREMDSKEQKKT
tara:strand:- start:1292 stop:1438 length:147 start_codon:yes stop_codon:yes gene_type:complete